MTNDSQSLVNTASEVSTFYEGERLNQMFKLATGFFKAGCFGADVKNPEQALVKIQAGFEMGLPPVEAMNSLYIINGKITIFGSAMTKRLRQKGWQITYDDKPDSCLVTITKGDETYYYTATLDELKRLNSKAAQFAPKEKLRYHALSRLIRFSVPEVLDAGVGYLKEELEDVDSRGGSQVRVESTESEPASERLAAKIAKCKTPEDLQKVRGEAGSYDLTPADIELISKALKKRGIDLQIDVVASEPATIEPETGEIVERKGFDASKVYTPERIAQMVAGLKTKTEVKGLVAELTKLFSDGEITDAVRQGGVNKCQIRLNQLVQEKR